MLNRISNRNVSSELISSYLYHIDEVVEILGFIDGQLVVLINHPVVNDLSGDAHAQDVVSRMTDALSHQEQAILGWL